MVWVTLACIFGIAVVSVIDFVLSRPKLTVDEVEAWIQAELPENANREQVEAWFDKRGIWHNYVNQMVEDFDGRQSIADQVGLAHRDVGGTVRGNIPDVQREWFHSQSITVYFFFDHQGRVSRHLVRVWDTYL